MGKSSWFWRVQGSSQSDMPHIPRVPHVCDVNLGARTVSGTRVLRVTVAVAFSGVIPRLALLAFVTKMRCQLCFCPCGFVSAAEDGKSFCRIEMCGVAPIGTMLPRTTLATLPHARAGRRTCDAGHTVQDGVLDAPTMSCDVGGAFSAGPTSAICQFSQSLNTPTAISCTVRP